MAIIKEKKWANFVKKNTDIYGKPCIDVARKIMEHLDKNEPFNALSLTLQVNKDLGSRLSFIQGEDVVKIVSSVHSRGCEFLKSWREKNE